MIMDRGTVKGRSGRGFEWAGRAMGTDEGTAHGKRGHVDVSASLDDRMGRWHEPGQARQGEDEHSRVAMSPVDQSANVTYGPTPSSYTSPLPSAALRCLPDIMTASTKHHQPRAKRPPARWTRSDRLCLPSERRLLRKEGIGRTNSRMGSYGRRGSELLLLPIVLAIVAD